MSLDDIQIEPDVETLEALADDARAGEFSLSDLDEDWAREAGEQLSSIATPELTKEQSEQIEETLEALTEQEAITAAQQQQISGMIEALNLAEENGAPTNFIAQNILAAFEQIGPITTEAATSGEPFNQETLLAPFETIANHEPVAEVDAALAEAISRRLAEVMIADAALGGALSGEVQTLKEMVAMAKSGQPMPAGAMEVSFANVAQALHNAQTTGSTGPGSELEKRIAHKQTVLAIEEMVVAERYSLSYSDAHYVAQLDSSYLQENAAYYINQRGIEAKEITYQLDSTSEMFKASGLDLEQEHNQGLFTQSNETILEARKQGGALDNTLKMNGEMSEEIDAAHEENRAVAESALKTIRDNAPSDTLQNTLDEHKRWRFGEDFSTIETKLLSDLAEGNISEEEFVDQYSSITSSLKRGTLAIDRQIFESLPEEVQQHLIEAAEEKGGTLFEDISISELRNAKEREAAHKQLFATEEFREILGDREFSELAPTEQKEVMDEAIAAIKDPELQKEVSIASAATASEFGKKATNDLIEGLYQHHIGKGVSHEQAVARTERDMLLIAENKNPGATLSALERGGQTREQAENTQEFISKHVNNKDFDVKETVSGLVGATVGNKQETDKTLLNERRSDVMRNMQRAEEAHAVAAKIESGEIDYGEIARLHQELEADPYLLETYGLNGAQTAFNQTLGIKKEVLVEPSITDSGPSAEEIDATIAQQERDARISGRAALIQFNNNPSQYGPESDVYLQASSFEMQLREEAAMRRDPSLRMEHGGIHAGKATEIYDSVESAFTRKHQEALFKEAEKASLETPESPQEVYQDPIMKAAEQAKAAGLSASITPEQQAPSPAVSAPTPYEQAAGVGAAAPTQTQTAAAEAVAAVPSTPVHVAEASPAPEAAPSTPNVLPQNDPAIAGPA